MCATKGGTIGKWPTAESDLAAPVIAYLEDLKWEVYQEVQCGSFGSIADLVAVQGRVVWVIELKRVLNFEVIAQAAYWTRYAHYASVAVPAPRRQSSNGRYLAYEVLEWKGVGYIPVLGPSYRAEPSVQGGVVRGRLHRKADATRVRDVLSEEHKTYAAAGNANGSRWTPFQRTCREVLNEVTRKPGIHLKELIDAINHHYASDASARSSLSTWIQGGKVKGVEARREGRYLKIFPVEKGETGHKTDEGPS